MGNGNFWFHHSIDPGEPLSVGDAFRWDGDVWRIDRIDGNDLYRKLWGEGDGPHPDKIHGTS